MPRTVREGLEVATKKRRAGAGKPRQETQAHVLKDGRVMQSAKDGVLAACSGGDVAAVQQYLATHSSAVEKVVDRHGSTALHWAAGAGHMDVCRLLTDHPDVSPSYLFAVNKDGRNALHWAARNGRVKVVEWCLEKGFAIDSATKSGNTALHWAIWGGQLEMCKWLIERGASLEIENATQCTAVHWAAARGRIDVCRYLAALGADFHSINSAGHGAVTKAAWEGHAALVWWLLTQLRLGYQLALIDVHGCTTAELAAKNGHTALAAALSAWDAGLAPGSRHIADLLTLPWARGTSLALAAGATSALASAARRRWTADSRTA